MRGGILACVVAMTALVVTACRDPTQITLEITTDADCAGVGDTEIRAGTLTQLAAPSISVVASQRCGAPQTDLGNWIGSLVSVPHGDNHAKIAFQITTALDDASIDTCLASGAFDDSSMLDDDCVVARRSLSYIPHTPLRLPIAMRRRCAGVECSATFTCVDGSCVDAEIDPNTCVGAGCVLEGNGGAGGGGGGSAPVDGWTKSITGGGITLTDMVVAPDGRAFVAGGFTTEVDVEGFHQEVSGTGEFGFWVVEISTVGDANLVMWGTGTSLQLTDIDYGAGVLWVAGHHSDQLTLNGASTTLVQGRNAFAISLEDGVATLQKVAGYSDAIKHVAVSAHGSVPPATGYHSGTMVVTHQGSDGSIDQGAVLGFTGFAFAGPQSFSIAQSAVTTFYKEVKAVAVRSQDARPFILGRGAMSFTLLTPSGYTAPEGDFLLESEGSQSNVTQLPGAHDTRLPVDLVLRGDTPCYALALSAGDGAENHAATSVDGTVHCDGDPSRVAWTRIIHGAGAQHLHDLSYEIGPNTLMSCGVADEALTIGATVVPNTGPRVWVAAFDANDGTLRWVDNATVADGVIQTTRVGGHGDPSGMVLAVDHDGQLDTPAGIVGSPNAPRQVTVAHWHLSP